MRQRRISERPCKDRQRSGIESFRHHGLFGRIRQSEKRGKLGVAREALAANYAPTLTVKRPERRPPRASIDKNRDRPNIA